MEERTAVAPRRGAPSRRGENYGGRSRQERASDRRARIVTAAVHLFGTRDYEDVTVADVCAGAKVSKRYFYEHFTDRENLLLIVHREQNRWLLGQVAGSAPPQAATAEELLRPMMRTLIAKLVEDPERARVIYVNAPRMETRRRGVLREDAQHFAPLVNRFVGDTADKRRLERTLLALIAGISEVIIDWISRDMAEDPDELADHLTWIAGHLLAH
ncbi:TetR/AcrR family transcriptional regulator [Actinoplanes sp. NPDC051343]|uniref:TetR/AcrR family transcriptional regulator n=1 Tax=Actinoplanes sp. NPDC051343 TaxID=3363906 RepID=UPI00378DB5C1